MHIKYWVEKRKNSDISFKREIDSSYLNEVAKYINNNDYYNNTINPSIFSGIMYYCDPDLMLSILYKIILNLRMPGIHDDIKTALLALKFNDINKLKEYKSLIEYCRCNLKKKNNILANIVSMLYKLKFSKKRNFRLSWSIVQLLIVFLDKKDAHVQLMNMFRKEISFDYFDKFFKE